MMVVKNSLFRLAVADTAAEGIADLMIGPRAVVFCYGDQVAPAKAIKEFGDDHDDAITLKGGFGEGQVIDEAQANRMATLPSRDELIASVVGGVSSPVTGLVFTLNGIVSDFVYTLHAVADQKESA
jgi:large subunit ribosomal protein L10